VVDAPYPHAHRGDGVHPRPLFGYALVWAAVAVWSLNATVMKVVLGSTGISAYRFSELRVTGATVLLFAALAVIRPATLRVSRRELPLLAAFGVCGLALGQLFYVVSIDHLQIGVALIIIYLAPVLVALWARFVAHETVRRRLWVAIAFSLAGLALVVEVWSGIAVDAVGLAAALLTALTFVVYVLLGDRGLRNGRDAYSLLAWGLLFGSLFWAIVQPWWLFPAEILDREVSLLGRLEATTAPVWLLIAYVIVFGTIIPFGFIVAALNYIVPTRVAIIATLEPVGAALVAFAWLGEELTTIQLVGGTLVLAGVGLAQTARAAPRRDTG
jgi:drug/metabolite transporter (DMT)-like permease